MKPITTARSVAGLKARAMRYHVRDSQVTGLELRVATDGTKSWTLRYRVHGQQRRLKLGEYPRLTLSQARGRANAELRKVDGGLDPQAERQATARAAEQAKRDSIEALCESYIERHAKVKKRTWRADQGQLRREVLKRWKGRSVTSITRRDCRALVQAVADRGAPIVANRLVALLSRLFRFAIDEEIVASNPATHLPKPGVEAAHRAAGAHEPKPYAPEEIRAIWAATEPMTPTLRAIYRLGLLTGQRPTEITNMEWGEVDGPWWTLPPHRTKNGRAHRVYLTPTALELLQAVPRVDDEPRVCARWRGKRQLAAVNAIVFAKVRRRLRPRHAMRDTVATGLAAAGVAIEDIAKVCNHAYGPRVTGIYNAWSYDREKKLAMGKWERRLLGILVDAEAEPPAVVAMAARR